MLRKTSFGTAYFFLNKKLRTATTYFFINEKASLPVSAVDTPTLAKQYTNLCYGAR